MGYFCGSLVYDDFISGGSRVKKSGESIMRLTKETFPTCVNRLLEVAMDMNIVRDAVWLVPAPCCAMHYVKDYRYLTEKEAAGGEKFRKERNNNVKF